MAWHGRGRPADTWIMDAAFANMAPGIAQAFHERSWHAVAVVQSSAATLIERVPKHLVSVLVMHDIRARLYERRASVAASRLERWRIGREARQYEKFEREVCGRFDLVVTVSAEDARWIAAKYAPMRVYALKLPVDTNHFEAARPDEETPDRIVFTGLLSHPPNIDAAVHFSKTVLPRVRARRPDAEFHVVGRRPTADVLALERLPGVRVFPDVPDIRVHVRPAAVVVVPLRYGSGSRQKILEAWSMEKCVVSTSIGAEGLSYDDGANLFIADTDEAMASAVIRALETPDVRARVRHAGREVAEREHNPSRLAAGYHAELMRVARAKAEADTRMRVLLDMRWMIPGLAGGIENLARAFTRELIALDGTNEYCALLPARCRHDFDVRGRQNFRIVPSDSAMDVARRLIRRGRRRMLSSLHLPDVQTTEVMHLSKLASLGVEIGYSFPGYIHPELWPLRNVLVIPDIQHEYLPEFFSPAAADERRRVYTDAARRADHICAISEFTRQTLIDRLGVAPDRVTTIPLAADPEFRAVDVTAGDADILGAHGLTPGRYLFFPAHTWKHKNHRVAVDALRVLRDRHQVSIDLVCTGGAREAQPALDEQIAASGVGDRVRFLGYVPRDHVPALYRNAACLVFPSLFEGFGMPVLEAMACGCPVVCSSTTSLPEIAGDAATLVNPYDPEALANAVAELIGDADLRSHRKAQGLARARTFSWRRHTLETVAVLRAVHQDMRRV
jgi:glycosyltransferase involved in cell wall biosynthesis